MVVVSKLRVKILKIHKPKSDEGRIRYLRTILSGCLCDTTARYVIQGSRTRFWGV